MEKLELKNQETFPAVTDDKLSVMMNKMLAFATSGFWLEEKKAVKKKSLFPPYNLALHNEKPQFILSFFPGPRVFRLFPVKEWGYSILIYRF